MFSKLSLSLAALALSAAALASPIGEPPPTTTNPSALWRFNSAMMRSKASRGIS